MQDRQLYAQILGIGPPWDVTSVELKAPTEVVQVFIEHSGKASLECPECGEACPGYDTRSRRWRHLDTCQYRTLLVVEVPRVKCPEHGVRQTQVPWAEPGSGFTALFEAVVISWLKEASISAVARMLRLTWDEVDGVMARAIRRGLARRKRRLPRRIGVDETSFQKRHEYVTVVTDLSEQPGTVLEVLDGHNQGSLEAFYGHFSAEELDQLEAVVMDMWRAYIAATKAKVPNPWKKIAFDKFHVAKKLGDAVDKVRRNEHAQLRSQGDDSLVGTKYLWLQNPENMLRDRWLGFAQLRTSALKTARAWAIKELGMSLWGYVNRAWARKAWKKWLSWALRCGLEPVRRAALMVKKHLEGILNAVVMGMTNAMAEGLNSKIQWIKRTACGYRNRERFKAAIYFHLAGLDLSPSSG